AIGFADSAGFAMSKGSVSPWRGSTEYCGELPRLEEPGRVGPGPTCSTCPSLTRAKLVPAEGAGPAETRRQRNYSKHRCGPRAQQKQTGSQSEKAMTFRENDGPAPAEAGLSWNSAKAGLRGRPPKGVAKVAAAAVPAEEDVETAAVDIEEAPALSEE